MGFEFYWPWMAVLLIVPLLVRLLWPQSDPDQADTLAGRQETLLHPSLANLQESFTGHRPRASISGRFHGLLLGLIWLFLTLTVMRPQWLEPYTETRAEGYDLMLAVDASHSMEALDFTVNNSRVTRMAVLKGVLNKFIANRSGDRVGLIIFGSHAYTLAPMTYDLHGVRQQLADVVPNIAGQGTAMGDAIGLGVKKLRARPEGSRVLILVADGDNNAGTIPPLDAARLAASSGVRIYTIGVGSTRESVPIIENGRLIYRDDLGMDEQVLRDIAGLTNGAYFRATDTRALEEIYRRIDDLEKTRAEARTVMIPHPLYRWTLGFALLLLLLLGLFPDGRGRIAGGGQHA
ncbi:MAG: VWA domain-containing protein [Gammaproteobacteria bacterium]|jgi:Ca-activated chloride channel family protein